MVIDKNSKVELVNNNKPSGSQWHYTP